MFNRADIIEIKVSISLFLSLVSPLSSLHLHLLLTCVTIGLMVLSAEMKAGSSIVWHF